MELSYLQTKLLNRNLNYFLYSLEQNSITLESDSPQNLEQTILNVTDFLHKQFYRYDLYSNIFSIEYSLSLHSKKIISSSCWINGFDRLRTSEFKDIHKICHKFLLENAKFLDYSISTPRLTWVGKKIFDHNSIPNITYLFPENIIVDEEDLTKFYMNLGMSDFFDSTFVPVSIEFELGVPFSIIVSSSQDGHFYQFYFDKGKFRLISGAIPAKEFVKHYIHKYEDLIVPEFVHDVSVECDFNGNETGITFGTVDREHIEKILVDAF